MTAPKATKKSTAPKTAGKDPAAPALAAVKKAEKQFATAQARVDKARAAAEKQAAAAQAAATKAAQASETAQAALARVEAERVQAEQVLAYAKAHPLLQGGTLDDAAAADGEPSTKALAEGDPGYEVDSADLA